MTRSRTQLNKGFTLVEVIVVVLIIAILATGTVMSFSIVLNANANKAASYLVSTLERARQKAIALEEDSARQATEVFVKLYKNTSDNYYYADICQLTTDKLTSSSTLETLASQRLGNYRIDLYLGEKPASPSADTVTLDTEDLLDVSATGYVKLLFNKSTGGITIEQHASLSDGGLSSAGVDINSYVDIYVRNKSAERILMVRDTGRCYRYGRAEFVD